jgi:hypothetical protein
MFEVAHVHGSVGQELEGALWKCLVPVVVIVPVKVRKQNLFLRLLYFLAFSHRHSPARAISPHFDESNRIQLQKMYMYKVATTCSDFILFFSSPAVESSPYTAAGCKVHSQVSESAEPACLDQTCAQAMVRNR